MKKEIADRWVEALRSGKYNQGKFNLNDGKGNFCCLGVLCELAKEEGIVTSEPYKGVSFSGADEEAVLYKDRTGGESIAFLPPQVSYWAGIDGNAAYSAKHRHSLSALNDAGQSFEYIAKIIEEEWENL